MYFAWRLFGWQNGLFYISSAVCTSLYIYQAPAWAQYFQPITEELHELHRPITFFKICCEQTNKWTRTNQVTYRALGSRQSQKHRGGSEGSPKLVRLTESLWMKDTFNPFLKNEKLITKKYWKTNPQTCQLIVWYDVCLINDTLPTIQLPYIITATVVLFGYSPGWVTEFGGNLKQLKNW